MDIFIYLILFLVISEIGTIIYYKSKLASERDKLLTFEENLITNKIQAERKLNSSLVELQQKHSKEWEELNETQNLDNSYNDFDAFSLSDKTHNTN